MSEPEQLSKNLLQADRPAHANQPWKQEVSRCTFAEPAPGRPCKLHPAGHWNCNIREVSNIEGFYGEKKTCSGLYFRKAILKTEKEMGKRGGKEAGDTLGCICNHAKEVSISGYKINKPWR